MYLVVFRSVSGDVLKILILAVGVGALSKVAVLVLVSFQYGVEISSLLSHCPSSYTAFTSALYLSSLLEVILNGMIFGIIEEC